MDAEIPLRPFTMLVGPNGSGKTTVLQAVELLGALVRSSIAEHLESHGWEYADLPHLRSRTSRFGIAARVRVGDERLKWEVELGARRYAGVAVERVTRLGAASTVLMEREGRTMWRLDERTGEKEQVRQSLGGSWLSTLDLEEDDERFPSLVALARWAHSIRGHLFLDPVRLRAPDRGDPEDIGSNGEHLAPFLARLRERDRKAFDALVDRVRTHYPRLIELHPKRTGYGWTQLEVTEKWNGEKATFNARQVSDGLLRLVAVAAMHDVREPTSVLLLDEIENGMHPHLLGGLISMLQESVERSKRPEQAIVTTHSPIGLNFTRDPHSVLVVTRRGGRTTIRPLAQAPKFDQLREHFDLGELWYNLGEEKLTS